jgi:hypothetical protein
MISLIRHQLIMGVARILSVFTGHRIILFKILPREGGYSFVRSPDLPGFTMMLEPGEAADIKSIMDALYAPVTAYLEAESRREAASSTATQVRPPVDWQGLFFPMHRQHA